MVSPDKSFEDLVVEYGGGDVKMCFQCGTCTASCPSGRITAYRTRKTMKAAQLGLKDIAFADDDLWQCTTCYACQERCPRAVPIVDIVIALRNIAVAEGHMYENHKKTGENLLELGHSVSFGDKQKKLRAGMGLEEVPPTVLANAKAMEDFKKILVASGFEKLVG